MEPDISVNFGFQRDKMSQNPAEQRIETRTKDRDRSSATATSPRDPFRHGDLPQRPNYLPEEGEVGRSDLWAIFKGVAIALAFIAIIAWLLSLR